MFSLTIVLAGLIAQAEAANPKFTARSNLVFLPTRVQDKKGEAIYGLTLDQFVVTDNGARQTVKIDGDPESEGLSLVVAIQCGNSAPTEYLKMKGLGALIDGIAGGGRHEVALVSFGEGPRLLADFTDNSDAVRVGLARLKPCNDFGAASIDTVYHAIEMLRQRKNRNRRAILLISETRDHGSKSKLDEVVAELGVTDTTVYAVAFSPVKDGILDGFKSGKARTGPIFKVPPGTPPPPPVEGPVLTKRAPLIAWPEQFLIVVNALRANAAAEMARLSGGEYVNFSSQKGFEDTLRRISNEIHNYYLLSFQAPPLGDAFSFHQLTVRVPDRPDAVIRTRKSYWSGIFALSKPESITLK